MTDGQVLFGFHLLVLFFGAAIGTSELVSRYRDAPFRALLTRPALLYIVLNALASVGALALIRQMRWLDDVGGGDASSKLVIQAMVAGLGAMALFRSSLFMVRVGSTDVGVGPAGFLQVLLSAADRACDRTRAGPRAKAVGEIMQGISFSKAKQALPTLCFNLMQNVSAEEQRTFGIAVKELEAAEMDEVFKSNNLGLALMNVVGEDLLRQAVGILKSEITAQPRAVIQSLVTLQLMRNLDFDRSGRDAVECCIILSGQVGNDKARTDLDTAFKVIERQGVPSGQKALLLSQLLIGKFGEETVQMVLRSLASGPGQGGLPQVGQPPETVVPSPPVGGVTPPANGAGEGPTAGPGEPPSVPPGGVL